MSIIKVQSEHSCLKQNMALQICKEIIDTYCNITTQTTLKKTVVIRGHPGAGKTSIYIVYKIILFNWRRKDVP